MKSIQAICFDLDNTLFRRTQTMRTILYKALKHISSSEEDRRTLVERALQKDQYGYTSRMEFNTWFVRESGLAWTALEFWEWMKEQWQTSISVHHAESTMLQELRSKYILGVISNGSGQNQYAKLRYTELERHFAPQHIWVSQEYGHAKPDLKIFQAAIKRFGIQAQSILFVGDHPVQDIYGAHQAGLQTCWIQMGRSFPTDLPQPTYSIPDVLQLTERLLCPPSI